jgi:hypothetical protein
MAPPPKQALNIIRIAMLAGVLVFGAVAYVVRMGGSQPALTGEGAHTLRLAGMVLWVIALLGLIGMRLLLRERIERGRDTQLPIIAWALAEAPALFGGVFFLMTGDWSIFAAGVVGLVAAFALFPVPERG